MIIGGPRPSPGTMSMFGNFGVNLGSVGNLFGASGPRLNYDLGDPYPRSVGGWTHYRGTAKEDGAPVSVFKFVCNDVHKERVRVEVAEVAEGEPWFDR